MTDTQRKHALIRCLDRILSTNWRGVSGVGKLLFAYKLKLDDTHPQVSIKGNIWLFTWTVVEFNNVKAWKTDEDRDKPKLGSR